MKLTIEASEKEIADLVLALQGQPVFNIEELYNRLLKEMTKGGVVPLSV